jgi:hypothetical protein
MIFNLDLTLPRCGGGFAKSVGARRADGTPTIAVGAG